VSGIGIWADGGCSGNPGRGAWAFVLASPDGEVRRSGFEAQTTNNRMELAAVSEALREVAAHPEWRGLPIVVTTDSQYVQKGISTWIHRWLANGWRTSDRKPVKNAELWRELWELAQGREIRWAWVLGHAGDPMNEACHQMVEEAISRGR
jgi:ribonuclease HI